ncbi:N-acetylmuramoyl-L-alanine amidase [Antarcticimicrobium sediminis]|uniref:N-acetylmuramoyl-L-alanine amidase n=1 Tax=Antarcticimicrobium sediminis TaxID=2546227 RepID=A0A4R5F0X9_9RHOB|nr:N-acetylmuramoyl-L-alanine amidase [Antarcticimicrobium sediminis]TDE40747.1 N-acetylmuramoyl-L-alanine amidase [Antarcticimicrobium sediminis]
MRERAVRVTGRILTILAAIWALAGPAPAQEFSGLARIDAEQSRITAASRREVGIDLHLSQGVPYRLFTLDGPPRLVLDFQEVDWSGLKSGALVQTDRIRKAQFGAYVPGWSRMVLELAGPMAVTQAGLKIDAVTAAAHLAVRLKPVSPEDFAATAGPPYDPRWDLPVPAPLPGRVTRDPDAPLLVVIDPGHGGIDPGAEVGTSSEKDLMLTLARELREVLLRSGGFEVVMTRDDDRFVSLERRVALAHQAGADVFLSLHADSLSEGLAHGATVYVLAKSASDKASALLAERHDRANLLAGVDLSAADDEVTDIMLDLARQETRPRTEALASALISGMTNMGGPMNRRPKRSAAFSVLKAADIPSVLIEVGFLSSPRDLRNLRDPEWRSTIASGIRNGVLNWRKTDVARRALVRQ